MKTYSFKHIFLALTLVLLGAAALPAAAVESNGNLFCDWYPKNGFQPTLLAPTSSATKTSTPSQPTNFAQKPNISQEEAAAIAEVDAIDESLKKQALLFALFGAVICLFGLGYLLAGFFTQNIYRLSIGLIYIMMATLCHALALHFSPYEREKRVTAEKEELRVGQLREIKRSVMRREAQRPAVNSNQ